MYTGKLRIVPDVVGDGKERYAAIIDPPTYATEAQRDLSEAGIPTHTAQLMGDFILTVENPEQWVLVTRVLHDPDTDMSPDFSG